MHVYAVGRSSKRKFAHFADLKPVFKGKMLTVQFGDKKFGKTRQIFSKSSAGKSAANLRSPRWRRTRNPP
jgi:hypothetical protein